MHVAESFTTILSLFQFSLIQKKENAHKEAIWSCAWGKYVPGNQPEEQNGSAEASEAPIVESVPDRLVFYIASYKLIKVINYLFLYSTN